MHAFSRPMYARCLFGPLWIFIAIFSVHTAFAQDSSWQVVSITPDVAVTMPGQTTTIDSARVEVINSRLGTGKYEKHLRLLRSTLYNNYNHYVHAIGQYFPAGTKTSRPQGGLALWVEFDKRIDTTVLYDRALRHGISIAPGRMFTLQNQFQNCIRLCIGLPWSDELSRKLRQIGKLANRI